MKFDTGKLCGTKTDRGFNQTTVSGKPFWPADPSADDVRIEDIAGSLSRICRFNGHLKDEMWLTYDEFYSFDNDAFTSPKQVVFGSDPLRFKKTLIRMQTFSVAQHSVNVCDHVQDPKLKLPALLHDIEEYIEGDDVKPRKILDKGFYEAVKKELGAEKLAEIEAQFPHKFTRIRYTKQAVADRFNFDVKLLDHPDIKQQDYRAVLTEHRDLQNNKGVDWGLDQAKAEPWPERIVPVLPSTACEMFMDRFNAYYQGD